MCLILCDPGDYRLLCPWDYPGKTTGVGSYSLLQVIFPTQGSNPGLLHWQADSLPSEPPGKQALKDHFFPSGLTVFSQNIMIYRNVKIYNIKQGKISQCMTSKITRQAKKQENMTHNENNNLLVFFSC